MNRVQSSALVSLVVGICHVVAGCGDSEEGSGGSSGTSGATTTGTADGPTTNASTTTVSSSSTGGDGGGGGAPMDPCEPTDGAEIPVTCGIFVNSNAPDGGNGQQDTPFNNLTEAVALADSRNNRIYVCGTLTEAVTVPEGLQIHGELNCETGWQWDFAQRTQWEALVDQTPLHFVGGTTPTLITGFRIESRDAVVPGQSSIAVIVEGGTLSLARTDVIAGDASGGQPGEPGAAGAAGTVGGAGGVGFMETGGTGGVSACGGATGGTGAFEIDCMITPSCDDVLTEATPAGMGGTSADTTCTSGLNGTGGTAGTPGADASGLGSITAAGFIATVGGAGTAGGVGGPGGGGGAKKINNLWGGGGGTGGCGAAGSTGGNSGGSSIAFISLDATILFEDVTARVGLGGNGGVGGASTPGGNGGSGGAGGCAAPCFLPSAACSGGQGGPGGAGGPGGNGGGGHAIIIAYTGTQSSLDGLAPEVPMNQGGLGGGGTAPNGQSAVLLEFP